MGIVELDLNPGPKTLRSFGLLASIGFCLLALCAWHEAWMFAFGLGPARVALAVSFATVAGTALTLSLLWPKANRPLYVGIAVLAFPIGIVLSYLTMAALFFLIITPIGLLLRALGKDPVQRTLRDGAASYFTRARPARSKQSYFRQF